LLGIVVLAALLANQVLRRQWECSHAASALLDLAALSARILALIAIRNDWAGHGG